MNTSQQNLKTRKRVTTTLRLDLVDKLDELARKTKISKSKLHDEAIDDLLLKYKSKNL
ncbi:ribbon-helix-helix domain-containing protein [Clostridium sp. D2Q-11]|uniref:Ribbon-helix-helix domain-containing protein n=1 Tax=Anaeromonas frigoriresistens TaxID=2683708 RepID=A0A942UPJ6_9FIRM|nr:ribbon-helix-helix domain-containing protein [Anaeromonas frigoriresistens]MBS4536924.1 ribbon-helix-helix domain-containing protein [Anaeromonas frigoriresistens]